MQMFWVRYQEDWPTGTLGPGGGTRGGWFPSISNTHRKETSRGRSHCPDRRCWDSLSAGIKTDFKMTEGRKHNVGVRTQRSLRSESPDDLVREALFRAASRRDPRGPVDVELKQRKKETMLPF